MVIPAAWMQETQIVSSGSIKLLTIFVGVIALSMVLQAAIYIAIAIKAAGAIKQMAATVAELKAKSLPIIDSVTKLTANAQHLVSDATPKIRIITDNLVDTSKIVKAQAQQIGVTVGDTNLRTQKQIARVDGMVTTALNTTAEIVEAVNNGIRVPAHKIAIMVTETKFAFEGILDKIRSKAAGLPFMR